MDSFPAPSKGVDRHRGITEKSKGLLFLLREAPYITLADAKRYFYPSNKTISYAREMIRVLVKSGLVARYQMGDGHFIYYLTDLGRRITEYYLEPKPRYDTDTKSFYYLQRPTKPSEVAPFFFFPTRGIDFLPFAPHYLRSHPFVHTRALMELNIRFRKSFRILHVLWLDLVKAKQTALNLTCRPDLVLCNSLREEKGRIFVEFENSRISDLGLIEKMNNMTHATYDWILFLASSESLLLNLGRLVRKVIRGDTKIKQQTKFFEPRAHRALVHNVLFGLWVPPDSSGENETPLRDTPLYRYDHEIFDPEKWIAGPVKYDSRGEEIRTAATLQKIPYPTRHQGKQQYTVGEILDLYKPAFRVALNAAMS